MSEESPQQRMKRAIKEGKKNIKPGGECNLNLEFLKKLKHLLEENGALANTVVGEDGYTAGEMYKQLLDGIEKHEKKSSDQRSN